MAETTRVYVLGAGCSCGDPHGYPLANSFLGELEKYAANIADDADCERIKKAVDATVKLMRACQSGACHASTLDQLVNLIWRGRCDTELTTLPAFEGSHMVDLRSRAVRNAKVATAACFLAKEAKVLEQQIGRYRNFIQSKVFGGAGLSDSCQLKLRRSNARVLSFNYDRLFELAFFAGFADASLDNFYAYADGVLNSGLTVTGEVGDIADDRFCFLKLHGSVGLLGEEDAFGQNGRQIFDVSKWQPAKVTDKLLCPVSRRGAFAPEPLIVFPYEKDFIVSGKDNKLPFRDYTNKVWVHATEVLRGASEIWVIGYSFDPTDAHHLIKRIHNARACQRIVIQNLPQECERIEKLLRVEEGIKVPIDKYDVCF